MRNIVWNQIYTGKCVCKLSGFSSNQLNHLVNKKRIYRRKVSGVYLYAPTEERYIEFMNRHKSFAQELLRRIVVISSKTFEPIYIFKVSVTVSVTPMV